MSIFFHQCRLEVLSWPAPYVGISWTCKVGQTAEFSKAEHEIAQNFGDVAGVRAWL